MSGIPILKFIAWAIEANFSSGPSTGLPTKVAPTGDVLIPGTPGTAPQFNYMLNEIASDHVALLALSVAQGFSNWATGLAPPLFSSFVTSGQWDAIAYDALNQRWIGIDGSSTSTQVCVVDSLDMGKTWNQWGALQGAVGPSTNCNVLGFAADAAGNALALYADHAGVSGGTETVLANAYQQGGASTPVQLTTSLATAGLIFAEPTGGRFFVLSATQSGGTFTAASYDAVAHGISAPTATAHTLPAGWISGTNHVGSFFAAPSAALSETLIAMGGVTPGADTAQLLLVTWTGSTYTFTSETFAALSGQIVTGVARSEALSLWAVNAYDGTNTHFYTSPDLVTWTLRSTLPVKSTGLASIGTTWITLQADPFGVTWRPSISQDNGATWHPGSFAFGSMPAAQIAVGPAQAMVYSAALLSKSEIVGLS
jgi:hypothetical protein